jgi:hypothetical protein
MAGCEHPFSIRPFVFSAGYIDQNKSESVVLKNGSPHSADIPAPAAINTASAWWIAIAAATRASVVELEFFSVSKHKISTSFKVVWNRIVSFFVK